MSEDNLTSESYWITQKEIPGSTRIPVNEINKYINIDKNSIILDIGSGEGRSTKELKRSFPNSNIVAFDLSYEGLSNIPSHTADKIQGTVLQIPFESNTIDCAVLCGVMTNITDTDPKKSIEARERVIDEIKRVLVPEGICVISDFNNEHKLSKYPVNYFRHQLITGEHGTIAVFDPSANISFNKKSDDEVAALAKSPHLNRFAHHYSAKELEDLVKNVGGFEILETTSEIGKTPSGNKIDTIVMTIKKKEE